MMHAKNSRCHHKSKLLAVFGCRKTAILAFRPEPCTQKISTWFWVENKNRCFSTHLCCQKLRFVVRAALFGAHHLRVTPAPGESLVTKSLGFQQKGKILSKRCVQCQKVRIVVTSAFFAMHHLRRTPQPGGGAQGPKFGTPKRAKNHVRKT